MGNHPSTGSSLPSSSSSSRNNHHPNINNPFRRPTGSLGLTRAELDERCKPSGLYESCSWDDRTIRKLIGDGKLAARMKGKDDRTTGTEQECPICFFHYDEINMLKCCKATICTECYLQVQSPNAHSSGGIGIGAFGGGMSGGGGNSGNNNGDKSSCPFCNKPQMSIVVAKRLDDHDVKVREEEEQKVIEATIRARSNSESIASGTTSDETSCSSNSGIGPGGFGSRLHREMMRTRSRTLSADFNSRPTSSSSSTNDNTHSNNDAHTINTIKNVAMTPEERRALEDQMRSQLSHPLMVEMQRNAELESQRHLLEHAERRRDRIRHSREELGRLIDRAREREHGLNLFAGTFDRTYDDDDDDDDDIDGGRASGISYGDNLLARLDGERGSRPPSMNDLYLLEAALYLSAREDSRRRRRNRSRGRRNDNSLLRALLSGGGGGSGNSGSGGLGGGALHQGDNTTSTDDGDSSNNDRQSRESEEETSQNDPHTFSAADILFAGLSEANQLEMAIQMSIRDEEERQQRERQQQQQQQQENEEADGSSNNVEEEDNVDNQHDEEAGGDNSNVIEQQEEENNNQEENDQEDAEAEDDDQVGGTRQENTTVDAGAAENIENSQVTSGNGDEAEIAEPNAVATAIADTSNSTSTSRQLESGENVVAATDQGAQPGV